MSGAATTVVFGGAGAALSCIDPVPYLRDVLRRRTRPHRGTWALWSVLGVLALSAQADQRLDWSVAALAVQAVSIVATFLLSISRGEGGTSAAEVALMALAGCGLVAWFVCDDPVLAIAGVIAADAVACLLMLPKSWRDPWSETPSSYALAGLAGACAAGAVGDRSAALLYPCWFAVANLGLAAVIVARRRSDVGLPRLAHLDERIVIPLSWTGGAARR
ncbi:hypothetical protein CLV35_3042 [Motilibacter peucedani]|uniref:Uncharacterized protein n=1 Tax=Motilibacter peucedani TaxID=598650 RepID=A0A420XND7_9ACTN|nr:hypothetical protein [Motilibacter peucedani]RKS72791.1 hypothetical protein CLV35_3042 [Motilibacter peucedani]